jgi:peptidoglycan hydrolase CwlO-like protein
MKRREIIKIIGMFSVIMLVSFAELSDSFSFAADNTASPKSQTELKTRIDDLRSKIEQYQNDISEKNKEEQSLQQDVYVINKDIEKIELQIQETQLVIDELTLEIEQKQSEIKSTDEKIMARRKTLSDFLQELYVQGEVDATEVVFGGQTFSDYLFRSDSLENFEEKTKEVHDQLITLQDFQKSQEEDLMSKRADQQEMRGVQQDQDKSLDSERQIKDVLISKSASEQEVLSQGVQKMQAELNMLQTLGEPIAIGEAIKSAKYASGLTNVAPEFLLGVLRVESGLGTNVGGGRYKTDMNPSQWDTFKKICKDVGLDPDKTPVSRRACYNKDSADGCGGWGGAMGPAQFMPSTWMGYRDKVTSLTSKAAANPWDIRDSLVAMGIKMASVDGVTSGDRKAWAKAAGMYLAGANWERYSWYSDRVLFYADGFKKMLKDY